MATSKMCTPLRRSFLIALTSLVSACATNQFSSTAPLGEDVSLKNSRLYVYSFLDLRDAELGANMLAEIDAQLIREFAKAGVTVKVLRFKNSEVGRYYATTNGGMSVPIGQTISSNSQEEQSLGAEYRLVIFPSKMTLSGAWRFYDVRWELMDVKTNKRLWTTTSQGKHLNMWKNDEDPQARANTIVNGIMAELQKSKLL
jgi:hypothetical protein